MSAPCRAVVLLLLSLFGAALADDKTPGSQFGQDGWVQSVFNRPRYYLDVGSNDGIDWSNTYTLDKAGWQGVCVDPFPTNHERRTCAVEKAAVFGYVKNVTFNVEGVYGGITDTLTGVMKDDSRNKKQVTLETVLLESILEKHRAPRFIDYFSLDVEGAEYEILRSFPFWHYTFGAITVEHNFEEPKRSQIRTLLQHQGYQYVKELQVDDCYVFKRLDAGAAVQQVQRHLLSRKMKHL